MHTQVALPALAAATRALQPYRRSTARTGPTRLLHLYSRGQRLTLAAGGADETAQVELAGSGSGSGDGGGDDGGCAVDPRLLLNALTALYSNCKAAAARVRLAADPGRLQLSVAGGPTVDLEAADAAAMPTQPEATPLTTGPVPDWCRLAAATGAAASRDPDQPNLQVLRLTRDRGSELTIEATDRYRIHRACWGPPAGEPADLLIPVGCLTRACRLLTACDPDGRLRLDHDHTHLYWRTETVRLAMRTAGGSYPHLEPVQQRAIDQATGRWSIDTRQLAAALATAARLAGTSAAARVRLEATRADSLDVTAYRGSGAPLCRIPVPATSDRGPLPPLVFPPPRITQAVTFLDSHRVEIAATDTAKPVHLTGGGRHAVLIRLEP